MMLVIIHTTDDDDDDEGCLGRVGSLYFGDLMSPKG